MSNEKGKSIKFDPRADPPWHPDMRYHDKPVYHGFWVEKAFDFEGFKLGLITEPEIIDGEEYGYGFLIAPDESRCGLIYEVGEKPECKVRSVPEPRRWGVWNVTVAYTMTTEEGRRKNVEQLVGMLKHEWERWRDSECRT